MPRPNALRIVLMATISGALAATASPRAQTPAETLLGADVIRALDEELSGATAKRHVQQLTLFHRVPASPGFHDAIEYIRAQAQAIGLADVKVETFPGDGRTLFGTLRGNRGWRVESGSLVEMSPRSRQVISFQDVRVAVADNSESADVTASLVDVGAGTSAGDYDRKDVKGKLVLSDGNPGAVHRLAVEERGAAGLVSYNSNQHTGWWRDDTDLVRWGHLDAQGRKNTFAIMISVREAHSLQQRLAAGETITLRAVVRARNDDQSPYETLVATIPGSDPSFGEVVFSCHLDHQQPGANDNASGCSAILEIARTLHTLIESRRITRPARTLRFIWPSEMTGTIAYLTRYPEIADRMKAAVHLDMVGADPFVTKSILHVTRSPWSLSTIADDVAEIMTRHVLDGAYAGAASGDFGRSVRSPGGSKDAFWADITPYESGSDHWIYQEGAFRIPTIYLRDWPDVYIHTNKDLVEHIEPTKIKRAAFIAAASGYYLAAMPDRQSNLAALLLYVTANAHARIAEDVQRSVARAWVGRNAEEGTRDFAERTNIIAQAIAREQRRLESAATFVGLTSPWLNVRVEELASGLPGIWKSMGLLLQSPESPSVRKFARDERVPLRNREVKGPLHSGADWIQDRAAREASALTINSVPNSGDVVYEIVNFIDGARTVSDIRDAVSAEFQPVELKAVSEYLDLLVKVGAVSWKR